MKLKKASLIVALVLTSLLLYAVKGTYAAYPANSMWIDPPIIDVFRMSVGDKFNVTVWLNIDGNCGAWQFCLIYPKEYVDLLRYGLTGTGGVKSQFFQNTGTETWGMVADKGDFNQTHGYIIIGESWKSGNWGTGLGSLAWLEFKIIATPPPILGLDIASTHHPPTSDTFALDPNQNEIQLTVLSATIIPEFQTALVPILLISSSTFLIIFSKRKKE